MEKAILNDGRSATVKLQGKQNVVLLFRQSEKTDLDPAAVWGFETIAEYRTFLKALLRFDEALGADRD